MTRSDSCSATPRCRCARLWRAALVATACATIAACAASGPGGTANSFAMTGLEQPVEVLVDRWGIAHIYAATRTTPSPPRASSRPATGCGRWTSGASAVCGEMARDFGPNWVESDRMARAVLYQRRPVSRMARLRVGRQACRRGVRRRRQCLRRPGPCPARVVAARVPVARLPARDLVGRGRGPHPPSWADAQLQLEVDRAQALCAGPQGVQADWLRRELDPPIAPAAGTGFDSCTLPVAELQRAYQLATAAPQFDKDNTRLALDDPAVPPAGLSDRPPIPSAGPVAEQPSARHDAEADLVAGFGSNNWVIAPRLTTTGRPILANDPHRAHGAPSLRYMIHLSAPGMDAIGAGEPFLPGLSIGHNGHIAFGLTRFYMDQEDLYVYEINPQNADEYRYKGRWEPMTERTERIEVKRRSATRGVATVSPATARYWPSIPPASAPSPSVRRGSNRGWRPTSARWTTCVRATGTSSGRR